MKSPYKCFLSLFINRKDAFLLFAFCVSDGLHLSPEGNSFVANQLLQLLDNIGLSAGGMKTEFPDFLSIDASEPKNSFK